MLNGVMLLWFLLTAVSVVFVAVDIRGTPESPVLKWGFILLTAYTGPLGAFLYVLGCREPLPGLHEQYVAVRWRQVLGSTMHCVAGDGLGILVGATIAFFLTLPQLADIALEYVLGFAFGWTIFQALFMRAMAGSYKQSLASTFIPEFLSMNLLMTGMIPVAALGRMLIGRPLSPLGPEFWFVMSMALLVGFIVAYPMNWWLVARGLKHGMMTIRPPAAETHGGKMPMAGYTAGNGSALPMGAHGAHDMKRDSEMDHDAGMDRPPPPPPGQIAGVAMISVVTFGLAVWFALALGRV